MAQRPPYLALPVYHRLALWALQPRDQLELLQESCRHAQLLLHLLPARRIQAPTLPTAAKSCWMLQPTLPGSSPELSAGSRAKDTCFGGELQGKLRIRLHQDLPTFLCVATPSYTLVLKPERSLQLFPTFYRWDGTPGSLLACTEAGLNSHFAARHCHL